MSHGAELSEAFQAQIVALRRKGSSWAEIGRFLNVNSHTTRAVFMRWENTNSYSSSPRTGRPKSLKGRDVRHIANHITSNRETRRQPLGEIINVLNLSVCSKTLRKTITKDIGLSHRIERKKPHLNAKQKAARLQFAKEHIHWTEEDWMKVAWSDEMAMQTDANQGQK